MKNPFRRKIRAAALLVQVEAVAAEAQHLADLARAKGVAAETVDSLQRGAEGFAVNVATLRETIRDARERGATDKWDLLPEAQDHIHGWWRLMADVKQQQQRSAAELGGLG